MDDRTLIININTFTGEYINLNLNENSIIKSREIRNRVCFQ